MIHKKSNREPRLLRTAVIIIALSIAIHIYLAYHHYQLKFGMSAEKSICSINDTFDCDAVSASSYSELWGSPLAIWGAVAHLILLMMIGIVAVFPQSDDEESSSTPANHMRHYAVWLSGFIFAASMVMAVISITQMSVYCLFCILLYVLSFLTLLLVGMGHFKKCIKNFRNDLTAILIKKRSVLMMFLAIPLFAFVIHNMILDAFGADQLRLAVKTSLDDWQLNERYTINDLGAITLGSPQAEMTIVEFADFLCGHCKNAYPVLHAFVKSHPRSRLVFMPFPLDGTCNPAFKGGSGHSCKLAKAVFCAPDNGSRWKAHDWIFNHQAEFQSQPIDPLLDKMISDLKLDSEMTLKCMESESIHEQIQSFSKIGQALGIGGTPAVFVNGQNLPRGQHLPILNEVYLRVIKTP